jgi:hypothetical protein
MSRKAELPLDRIQAAKEAIENGDDICYDVAANHGQIFDNVKHMGWFIEEVANELSLSPAEGASKSGVIRLSAREIQKDFKIIPNGLGSRGHETGIVEIEDTVDVDGVIYYVNATVSYGADWQKPDWEGDPGVAGGMNSIPGGYAVGADVDSLSVYRDGVAITDPAIVAKAKQKFEQTKLESIEERISEKLTKMVND